MLRESLKKLWGDARTQLTVVTYDDASVHLYLLQMQSAGPAASANIERRDERRPLRECHCMCGRSRIGSRRPLPLARTFL